MSRLAASIILCLCVFLGNISAQAKAYQIVEHLTSSHKVDFHEHHHYGHGHHHHHEKKQKNSKNHDHSMELSSATPSLFFPSPISSKQIINSTFSETENYFSYTEIIISSFLDSIFRPPIA